MGIVAFLKNQLNFNSVVSKVGNLSNRVFISLVLLILLVGLPYHIIYCA